jgi:hypothetical protein
MIGSATPLARAVRTFLQAETGVLVTAVGADWVANTRASAVVLALGTIAALLAGIVAFLVAQGSHAATTPIGKAIASAAQFAGAGLATVGIADLTGAAAIEFEHTVLKVIIAAVLTGFVTLAQNTAEQGTVAPPA